MELPRNTSGVTTAEPQGWYEDPFQLHEARYFSAGRPTKLVRDGNVESYDEPPGESAPGAVAVAAGGNAASATLTRVEASRPNNANSFSDGPAYTRRRPRSRVLTAVAVVAIAGGATTAFIAVQPRPANATATEATAYAATMHASSAVVSATYAMTTGTRKSDVAVTESGPVSWSADQGETAMTMTLDGGQFMTGRQIFDGTKTYSKTKINGVPAAALSGLPGAAGWTETTWTGASSQATSGVLPSVLSGGLSYPAGTASPASMLELLRAQASSVQTIGGEVLDGINTTHYRALIPLSRLGDDTPADEVKLQQALGTSSIGVDYWIDSSNLLRQLRFAITELRAPSGTSSSPGEVTVPLGTYPITFSIGLQLPRYGTPVHVVPPPSAQITSRATCVVSADGFSCTS